MAWGRNNIHVVRIGFVARVPSIGATPRWQRSPLHEPRLNNSQLEHNTIPFTIHLRAARAANCNPKLEGTLPLSPAKHIWQGSAYSQKPQADFQHQELCPRYLWQDPAALRNSQIFLTFLLKQVTPRPSTADSSGCKERARLVDTERTE